MTASVFTTESVTSDLEKIRDQIHAATPDPAYFNLGPEGSRTVFNLDDVSGITWNQQIYADPEQPLNPVPVSTDLLNVVPGAVGQIAFGKYRSPDYEVHPGEFIPAVATRTGAPVVQGVNEIFFNVYLPSSTEPDAGWPVLAKAEADLKAARRGLKQPEFRQQVDALLAKHEQQAGALVEAAERRLAILGQPAADWSTTDLDGKPHSLKEYHGKVVVLDFWYRQCYWCLRAMPQIKEIAACFKDQPVVVLGMNTDAVEEDARVVVEKMGLNYLNLKAAGLPEKYKVQSFPTLIVIDPEGIVRDIHAGYSATLKEDIVQSVKRLLKSKP